MPLLYKEIMARVPVKYIRNNWPVALPVDHASTGSLFPFRRAWDVTISGVGLTVLAILFPLLALAVYLD